MMNHKLGLNLYYSYKSSFVSECFPFINMNCIMHVLLFVEWCLFIYWCMYSFVCTICESILEADFVVEDPITFEDDLRDTFEQGKWILPLHFYLYLNNAYNNVYFSDIA
jgi:hypothetical protein